MNKQRNLYKVFNIIEKIILFFLVSLIFYIIYRSEIFYDGLYRDYYIKYFIFLTFLFIALFSLRFFNKSLKSTIYIVFSSIILGFYIIETFLIDYKNINLVTKHDHYLNLKKKYDIVVSTLPSKFILREGNKKKIFPLSGISKKKTIYCKKKENEEFIIYKSDRYGFRNKDENWDKNIVDFVLLGDSFVQGSCVNFNETIGFQISRLLQKDNNKKINTINLGYNGNGPLIEYATLKEYLKKTKAKKVLYFFYEGNDLDNLNLELKDNFLIKYLHYEFEQKLINKQNIVDRLNQNLLKEEENKTFDSFFNYIKLTKFRLLLIKSSNNIFKPKKIHTVKNFEAYNKILINLKKLATEHNSEFYFIYLPYVSRFTEIDKDINFETYFKIESMVKKLNIKYIDMLSEIESKQDDPLSMFELRKYQHFNKKGYKFIAETIIKKINGIN